MGYSPPLLATTFERRPCVVFEKKLEKRTSYKKCVDTASDFNFGCFYVDTGVETRVIHCQVSNGDGVTLQRSVCLNPVGVSVSWADFVS